MINKKLLFKPDIAISNTKLYFLDFLISQLSSKNMLIRFWLKN